MADSLRAQLEKLQKAIAGLEEQRGILGDEIIEPALEGLYLQVAALEAQQLPEVMPATADERRIITILFADIVGSTALAEKLDPEDWHDVIATVHKKLGNLIQQHNGVVAQYLGDGILALFGAHNLSERDSENAIRAALDIQTEISTLQTGSHIQMRVGINTGLVVLGEIGSETKREFTATGDAMNLASRLQSAAPSGGIVISHDTYRYVRGVFDVTSQPPLTVKGKSEPIQTYFVQRAKPRPFRTVTRGVADIETRTVGREVELKQLRAAYSDAFKGNKFVWVQLVGEPGVGKSRLLGDISDFLELRPEEFRWLRARAFEGDEKQAFAFIRQMWFDRFQIAEDAPLADAESTWVEQFLALRGEGFEEAAHALGLLAGLSFTDSPFLSTMRNDPAQVKGRAFVVSRELLAAIRAERPIVVLLEDLHWTDTSSWEYLVQVIVEAQAAPNSLFVLATARPEWHPPETLLKHSNYIQIDLASLSDAASHELATELLRDVENVPDEVPHLIAKRSEGVPYFVEEMINWFLDRDIIDQNREPWRFFPARLDESPLPATLQHLLLTRLSYLKDTQRTALQRGSIFGRNFWSAGLEALGVRSGNDVLTQVQKRGFVVAQPESSFKGENEWSFRHNLLREVTYESVLKRERAHLHKAAAAWLEAQAREAGRLDEFAGLLAEHVERAGEMSAAADWYLRAGEGANSRGASSEARKFFDRALELVSPDDHEQRWRGLLGRSLVLGVLGESEAQQADLAELLALAKTLGDGRLAEAHYRQGFHFYGKGDCRTALQAYEDALTMVRHTDNRRLETLVLAAMVICQGRLGQLDAAAATAKEALANAQELGDEATLTKALTNVAVYYVESGDIAKAAQLHNQQVAINHRLGDRVGEAVALANLGYDYVLLGLYALGRDALEQSLQMHEAIGDRRQSAYGRLNLGLAVWRSGDAHAAQEALEQLQSELDSLGDAFGHAIGLSYLALFLEQTGDLAGAIQRFAKAREILDSMGARGYANDALVGLARSALAQGNLDEAQRHANEIWGYIKQNSTKGMEFPVWAYQTCAEIFAASGDTDKSLAAVEAGYHELIARAEKISDLEWGESFLSNVPEHRAMITMWDRVADRLAAMSSSQSHRGG